MLGGEDLPTALKRNANWLTLPQWLQEALYPRRQQGASQKQFASARAEGGDVVYVAATATAHGPDWPSNISTTS